MALLLLMTIFLTATAAVLVIRGLTLGRGRAAENVAQIATYGYVGRAAVEEKPTRNVLDSVAARAGDAVASRVGSDYEAKLRSLLMAAGMYSMRPRRLLGYRLLAAIVLPPLWLWIMSQGTMPKLLLFLSFPVVVYAAWWLPLQLVRMRARRRMREIDYELPEPIDLLVVTVEAGLGFTASLQMAAERLRGALGQELRLAIQEQRMGLSPDDALRNMLERADTPAMRSFVRSILQGETLGVSIGQIMRNLASEMRKRRKAAAEEKAQKAPVKILFPLVFLIFPSMFLVILGPVFFHFARTFGT
jgi:tight adherence protein C